MNKLIKFHDVRGKAEIEYEVDAKHNLNGNVVVTFVPFAEAFNISVRPCVVKLPKKLIEQFCTFPMEMHGVPIDIIVKIAHFIKAQTGTSIIDGKTNEPECNSPNQ